MLATGTSRRDTAKDMAHAPCALLSWIHPRRKNHLEVGCVQTYSNVIDQSMRGCFVSAAGHRAGGLLADDVRPDYGPARGLGRSGNSGRQSPAHQRTD